MSLVSQGVVTNMENGSMIRKMFEEGNRLRAIHGAENVFDFSLGNPDSEPPQETLDAIRSLASQPNIHKYMPNAGFPDVRARMAAFVSAGCKQTLSADQIVMTVGAAGGLNVAMKALLNPGEEVVVLAPYFVEYLFYIRNHGGVPRVVPTGDGFQPDPEAIRNAINEKTKAIILNSPNNPSGAVYGGEVLARLAAVLAQKEKEIGHPIAVVSDEPYAALLYEGVLPSMMDYFPNALVVNSFSKTLSLPGDRIGYIAVNPQCANLESLVNALVFCTRTLGFVNAPGLMQRAVAASLEAKVNVDEYRARRDLLYDIVTQAGFTCTKPQGAFYLFPKSPIPDDAAFTESAAKHNLLLVPGSGFGAPGYFRMAYCVSRETISRARDAFMKLGAEYFG